VELPLIQTPAVCAEREPSGRGRKQLRVLVVEDNPDTRAVLAETLTMLAYQVLPAESGEEALALLAREPVDVILSDIGLPGMDGYQFLREVRRLPSAARLPAFAVTGYGEDSDVRRACEAGFVGHFVKPFALDTLDQHIRESLGVDSGAAP
jgi:two-component system CheB/CheR fusion protein